MPECIYTLGQNYFLGLWTLTLTNSFEINYKFKNLIIRGIIMKKVAFIFPGQGSQTVGMGKDFFWK